MDNYLMMKKNKELEQFSYGLGFSKTLFLDSDFVVIKGRSRKEILDKTSRSRGKITLFEASSEEMVRFVLEKTSVNLIMGVEKIHFKDSVHYVKGGLDQILCKIVVEKGKTIGFSFTEILNEPRILRRMIFNIKLCQKYGVKTVFSNFSTSKNEIRSASDLTAFWRTITPKQGKLYI